MKTQVVKILIRLEDAFRRRLPINVPVACLLIRLRAFGKLMAFWVLGYFIPHGRSFSLEIAFAFAM